MADLRKPWRDALVATAVLFGPILLAAGLVLAGGALGAQSLLWAGVGTACGWFLVDVGLLVADARVSRG